MPIKYSTAGLQATSQEILNVIRANASADYKERVPLATQDNLAELYTGISSYQSIQNEFLSALVNRIGLVLLNSKVYQNPLREFKLGLMAYGETIESIFVNMAKAKVYDPEVAETELFKREIPDVKALFHTMNLQNFYKATVSNEQLRQAFLSWQGITDLISGIVDSLYSGANADEFRIMKNLIQQYGNAGKFYPVTVENPIDEVTAKKGLTTIKEYINNATFVSTKYNSAGVETFSDKKDLVLLINTHFDALIDVQALAYAFNMNKADVDTRKVVLDDFGGLENVVAILVDKSWFVVLDNMLKFTENYNGQGLYWQYFYHVWKTFSTSSFANAIAFTYTPSSVTSVTINTPSGGTTVNNNKQIQMSANVVTTGLASKEVLWSITGSGLKSGTTINSNGLLTIAPDEKNSFTVTAISTLDNTKGDNLKITVNVPNVTSVTVTPTTATVKKGDTKQLSATVVATNNGSTEVTWSVTGTNMIDTTISPTGLLVVGNSETATALTVTATSVTNSAKTGTSTITVTA